MDRNHRIKVTVFAHPAEGSILQNTIRELGSLIGVLHHRYGVPAVIELENGELVHPRLAKLLEGFISIYAKQHGHIDMYWLSNLMALIKGEKTLSSLVNGADDDSGFLEHFLVQAMENAESLKSAPLSLFLATQGLRLKEDQPLWGGCIGDYPSSVAVETSGYRESIFHEFLHQFGVSEGYDETTKPLPGCGSCWMQYNSTLGSGLCSQHLNELRTFLSSLENI